MSEAGYDEALDIEDDEIEEDLPPFLASVAVMYVLLLALGLLWCWLADRPVLPTGGLTQTLRELLIAGGIGFLTVAVVGAIWKYTRVFSEIESDFAERLGKLQAGGVILLATLSSLAEEVFFRGAFQPFLADLSSPALGYIATSLIFGLLHSGSKPRFFAWTLFATAAGFILGAAYLWSGHLLVPVVIHFIINAVNMQLIAVRARARDGLSR